MVVAPAHKPPRTRGVRTTYVVFERVRMYTRIHHKNQHSNTNARTQVHKAAIELARKRVERPVDLRIVRVVRCEFASRSMLIAVEANLCKTERTYISDVSWLHRFESSFCDEQDGETKNESLHVLLVYCLCTLAHNCQCT